MTAAEVAAAAEGRAPTTRTHACFAPVRHSREHQFPPQRAHAGQFAPARRQPVHVAGTRKRLVRSSSSSVGAATSGTTADALRGVAGASEEETVSSESMEGVGEGLRRVERERE